MSFSVDDDDVNFDCVSDIKLSGAQCSSLQSCAGFYIPSSSCLYVFGGLNLSLYSMSQELLIINYLTRKVLSRLFSHLVIYQLDN